ncbi:MAG: hypothetical protein Q9Q40_04745 [Acidobacteriota bacterium]|nr:hypothetical protein [Acidobacteriota bacterium]MDQ7088820.1 hypothetical protein [Acidobacteriota bacterium]
MRRSMLHRVFLTVCLLAVPALSSAQVAPGPSGWLTLFTSDPMADPAVVVDGPVAERLNWQADMPAFPGDRPGSLAVLYRSDLPAARLGWRLADAVDETMDFVAGAVFVLDGAHFEADPFGFFQVSWGLWNERRTGLDRTGDFDDPAADTFELLEFDYFPNVSPYFGGPWLSPTTFGAADPDNPVFDTLGAFANLTFGSAAVELPLDTPLIATLEHRAGMDAVIVRVGRITPDGGIEPIEGAEVVEPLAWLSRREYGLDTLGLTLWHDGYTGPTPALDARVIFHGLFFFEGLPITPEEVLDALY